MEKPEEFTKISEGIISEQPFALVEGSFVLTVLSNINSLAIKYLEIFTTRLKIN